MIERLTTVAAVLIVAALWASSGTKPAADASPVIAGNPDQLAPSAPAVRLSKPAAERIGGESSRASISPPAIEDRQPAPVVGMAADAGFTSCGPGCAARAAAAPVRFVRERQPVRRAWANRPRVFGRVFGRR